MKSSPRLPRRLPDDACPRCGTPMQQARGSVEHAINGETIKVPGIPHLSCPSCGEKLLDSEATGRLMDGAAARYRKKYGLLAPAEIVALRQNLGLTQAGLGRLLRLGQNTVWRWETGRVVQTAAMDMLLRMLQDLPGSLEYVKLRAA